VLVICARERTVRLSLDAPLAITLSSCERRQTHKVQVCLAAKARGAVSEAEVAGTEVIMRSTMGMSEKRARPDCKTRRKRRRKGKRENIGRGGCSSTCIRHAHPNPWTGELLCVSGELLRPKSRTLQGPGNCQGAVESLQTKKQVQDVDLTSCLRAAPNLCWGLLDAPEETGSRSRKE
jgi:hypothetical protein